MKILEYPFSISEIKFDKDRRVAVISLVSSTPTSKKEISDGEYVDEIMQVRAVIELPGGMIYTGNRNHRAVKQEYKNLVGMPLTLKLGDETPEPESSNVG